MTPEKLGPAAREFREEVNIGTLAPDGAKLSDQLTVPRDRRGPRGLNGNGERFVYTSQAWFDLNGWRR